MAKYGGEEYKDIHGIREIRFRGRAYNVCKELCTSMYSIGDAWVYGDLIQDGDKYFIKSKWNANLIPVPKETIGEYTGVNGAHVKLYEGDILQKGKRIFLVTWKDGAFGIENVKTKDFKPFCAMKQKYWEDTFRHVGNMIDTPELLNQGV
jgi:hypothetical protein